MDFKEAVEKAKNGEESGYQYLYKQTYQKNYYVALSYMKQEEAAQDVLQEAYIKAFNSLEQLQDADRFPQWIARIVTTKALDELKKRKLVLFSQMENDEEGDSTADWIEDERLEVQPEISLDKKETSRLVQEMIAALSEEQKVCILSFYMEEMSVKEIAEALGVSENTVKSRLNYGRKKIQEKVLELEKKGTKLYGLAPVPFFVWLLCKDSSQVYAGELPPQVLSQVKKGGEALASGSAKSLAAGATSLGAKKIVVGIATAVLLAGGGIAAVAAHQNSEKESAEEAVVEQEPTDEQQNAIEMEKAAEAEAEAKAAQEAAEQQAKEQVTEKPLAELTKEENVDNWFDGYETYWFYAGCRDDRYFALLEVKGSDAPILAEIEEKNSSGFEYEANGYYSYSSIYAVRLHYWDAEDNVVRRIQNANGESPNGALIDGYMTDVYVDEYAQADYGMFYLTYLPEEKLLVGDLVGSSNVVETYEFDPKTGTLHTVETYLDEDADALRERSKDICYFNRVKYARDHMNQVVEEGDDEDGYTIQ